MEFVASEDMHAIISAQTAKKLTLGVWTKCHVSKLVLESKVSPTSSSHASFAIEPNMITPSLRLNSLQIKLGLKLDSVFPFVSRIRLCFTEPPYVSLCAKPIGTFGIDMTEVPGISGWIVSTFSSHSPQLTSDSSLAAIPWPLQDKILSGALEDSMVEPKMLVIDVRKLMAQETTPASTSPLKNPLPTSGKSL